MRYEQYKERGQCPKCGNIVITTQHDRATDLIIRSCTRCAYAWKELPKDSEEKKRHTDLE